MPNRIIREGILSSERVDKIAADPPCEIFYRRLFSVVDDYGRYSGDPRILRAALYPLRLDSISESRILEHIAACEEAALLMTYTVDRKPYLELFDFRQRLRRMVSRYPSPPAVKRPSSDSELRLESESEVEVESETENEIESATFKSDIAFQELWDAYPAKGRTKRPLAEPEYQEVMKTVLSQEELHREIMEAVNGKWKRSKLWSEGFVTSLGEFLRLHRWLEDPEPAFPKIPGWT